MNLVSIEDIQKATKRLKKAKLFNKEDKNLFERTTMMLKNPEGYFSTDVVNKAHDLIEVMYLVEFSKTLENIIIDKR